MKPSDPRSWRITVHARSNAVDLRLRLRRRSTAEPQNGGADIHNARPRSKLLGFLGKLFGRRGWFLRRRRRRRRRRSSAPLWERWHDRSVGSVCVEWIGAAQQLCQDRWMMLLIIFVLLSVLVFKLGNLNSKNSMGGVPLTSAYLWRREIRDYWGPFLCERIRNIKLMTL